MLGLDTKKKKTNLNCFEKAFYALDNKKKGCQNFTDRQRVAFIIKHVCQISDSCLDKWLIYPDKIAHNHKYFIAVAMNIDLYELFPKTIES